MKLILTVWSVSFKFFVVSSSSFRTGLQIGLKRRTDGLDLGLELSVSTGSCFFDLKSIGPSSFSLFIDLGAEKSIFSFMHFCLHFDCGGFFSDNSSNSKWCGLFFLSLAIFRGECKINSSKCGFNSMFLLCLDLSSVFFSRRKYIFFVHLIFIVNFIFGL